VHLADYFGSAAEWFCCKNPTFMSGESKRVVEMSSISLPDLHQMTSSPTSSSLFFFIFEACIRGDSPIMDVFISTLVNAKGMDKRWEDKKVVQLNCEYLMIEAAANAQAKVCSLLLPWCDFQAFTL
jgi:hypothetical protein